MSLKYMLSVFFCTALVPLLNAAENSPGFLGDKRPPRKIQLDMKNSLAIPQKAGTLEIVVAADAFPITKNAAEELRKYLEKRLDTSIPIVQAPTGNKISLILGINVFSRKAGLDDSKLCRDAFMIQRQGKKIYILGKDDPKAGFRNAEGRYAGVRPQLYERGTLFGVYDFLERFGGIRFFWPNELGTVIPSGAMTLPGIDIYDRPDFEARYYSLYNGVWEGDPPQTSARGYRCGLAKNLQGYRNRLQTFEVPCGHGIILLHHTERFAKSHPEYFALKKDGSRAVENHGQLCLSSAVTDDITRSAALLLQGKLPAGFEKWLRNNTQRTFFDHHYNDGYIQCECDKCQAHYSRGDQATSDFVWGTVAKTARYLKEQKIPGTVTMMAYWPYHHVPNIELPDNIMVMVATVGPWGNAARNALIEKWYRKLNRKVWLWNYTCKLGHLEMPGIPSMTPRAVGTFYQRYAPYIYGAFMEVTVDRMSYNYLNYYVFGKIAWDNKTDLDALLKDHYKTLYGPAAGPMEKIFGTLEENWLAIAGKTVETPLGPQALATGDYELFRRIYSPSVLADLKKEFDSAEKMSSGNKNVLARVRFIRSEFLDPLASRAAEYERNNDRIAAFAVPMAVEKRPLAPEQRWRNATVLYLQPLEGTPFLKGRVKTVLDPENLYVRFEAEEPEMDRRRAADRKHDDRFIYEDDSVEIFVDPQGKRESYYHIIVNAKGSVYDMFSQVRGDHVQKDLAWNSDARAVIGRIPGGWAADITLPRKNLGVFNPVSFVANFCRNRVVAESKSGLFSWSPFLKRSFHEPDAFGTLLLSGGEGKNLIQDGTFQADMKPHQRFGPWSSLWTLPENAAVELDKTSFIFGDRSLRMLYSGTALLRGFNSYQALPAMKPNTKYRISYFVKTENVKPLRTQGRPGVTVNLWSDQNHFFPRAPWTGSRDWTYESYEFTSGPETNANPKQPAYIMLWLGAASGSVWFDGVRLEEVPSK